MKKTISITIGGLVFNVEEDGYTRLNTYLESLKVHFASVSYGPEVIADIESRIAEQFAGKTAGNSQRAITDSDVEEIIKSIGSAEQFDESGSKHEEKTETKTSKKLYRNPDDVIVGGVASGLAAYFGIDTIIVRIIFGISLFTGGWGVLPYFLLWMIMPVAKTPGQKMEMKGSPITIKEIEQTAKEKIAEVQRSGAGRKLADMIGFIIKMFVRFILAIIGFSLVFAAAVATFTVTFSAANLIFNRNSPYVDFPFANVFPGAEYFFAILLLFVIVIIPLIYLALAGITLIRMKKPPVNAMLATVLSILWVAAVIGGSVITLNKLPAIQSSYAQYRGDVESRAYSDLVFNKIDASSAYKVNVTPGNTYAVSITGHSHDLDTSDVRVENNTLIIGQKNNFKICFFCFVDEVTVNITTPNLDSIKGSGAINYTIGKFKSNSFDIDLSGASKANISDLATGNTQIDLSGASGVTVSGTGQRISADISGASRLSGFDFQVQDATIQVSGASHAELNPTKTLDAEASGASTVFYRNNPTISKQDESGSSRIRHE